MVKLKTLVLGASGFLGKNLCAHLSNAGDGVRAFCRSLPGETWSARDQTIEWRIGDFSRPEDLRGALRGCELVFHLIGTTTPGSSNRSPSEDARDNIVGTIQLLDIMRDEGVPRIIFVSSGGAVYGDPSKVPIPETATTDPISAYGISKLAIEKYLALYHRLAGIDYRILRIANIYGEGQPLNRSLGAVGIFLDRAFRNLAVEIWGDGRAVRDYVHVEDVCRSLLLAREYAGPLRIFNIGSGQGLSLNDLLDRIEKQIGRKIPRRYLPARSGDVSISVLDIALAREVLGWMPRISFADGLRRTIQWWQNEWATGAVSSGPEAA